MCTYRHEVEATGIKTHEFGSSLFGFMLVAKRGTRIS